MELQNFTAEPKHEAIVFGRRLSPEAEAQLDSLIAHYEALGRVEASINLLNALERAKARISERPEAGLPAPRPYPALAKAGRRWIIEGTYWISYS
jgi:plasmid stabilization system protein ParE